MQLDWNERIADFSMPEIREFMRNLAGSEVPADAIVHYLPDHGTPSLLLNTLFERGWLEVSPRGMIQATLIGCAVAGATKLKRIPRERATLLLSRVLTAAHEINREQAYAFDVTKLAVFGSYLTDQPDLGDLDMAYDLRPRWHQNSTEQMQDIHARSNSAFPPPKSADFMKKLRWPETVVLRKLRVSRRVSFDRFPSIVKLGFPHRIIFCSAENDD